MDETESKPAAARARRALPVWRYARGAAVLLSGLAVLSARGYEAWTGYRSGSIAAEARESLTESGAAARQP